MKVSDIRKVAVIGTGIMGCGIAQGLAEAGISVTVVDRDDEILQGGLNHIDANLRLFQEFGLLQESPTEIKSRIGTALSADLNKAAKNCEVVIEAIPEILDLKRALFTELDRINDTAILCSNTSSLTISDIAEGLQNPERVVGLHYFNPAHIIPAVEIHRGRLTSDESVSTARELMLKIGKKPVLVRKEVPGFIINRLTGAMEREIDYLLDEGIVTPEDLDTAVKASYGFRLACLGPMEAEDMIGLDTAARSSGNIFKVLSNKTEPSPELLKKVDNGELGVKSGQGWYDYKGKTREQIGDEINRRLLQQLSLFNNNNKDNM